MRLNEVDYGPVTQDQNLDLPGNPRPEEAMDERGRGP